MENIKNAQQQNRQLVTIVRIRPLGWFEKIDFSDYKNPRIWAIIPAWKDANGVLTSIKTGKVITVTKRDEIRPEGVGTAFDYEDGTKVIFTRGWKDGKYQTFLAERTCRDSECVVIPAFGEDLSAPPKLGRY